MENELEKALEKKFFCPSKFAQDIEKLVLENDHLIVEFSQGTLSKITNKNEIVRGRVAQRKG